ncbi:MAG: enoyl-CoA hydratase/isomerase family protein [Deltaproteobacteria bacterium]|nr:enoyl-CoA hydratase/isomerase family protein [Deltaproteobacteria bacterium]
METLKLDWPLGDSSIAVVTLNRPDALNAMNTRMIQELLDLFREQAYNEALRCMVLTGAGNRAFSTGGDLKERNGMSNDQWRHQHHLIEDTFKTLWDFPIPIIAAVEGFAYAGGCELALSTDFIIASATAEFALKEVTRGILPGGGGLQNLARSIGMRRAREMIYTGRAIDAETAYSWGLVNRVVPAGEAMKSALTTAAQIAESAPMAVRMAKLSTGRGQDCDSGTAYALDIAAYNVLIGSQDRLEGIAAFNEKRKPRWKNR